MPKVSVTSVKISIFFFSKNKSNNFFMKDIRIDFAPSNMIAGA